MGQSFMAGHFKHTKNQALIQVLGTMMNGLVMNKQKNIMPKYFYYHLQSLGLLIDCHRIYVSFRIYVTKRATFKF